MERRGWSSSGMILAISDARTVRWRTDGVTRADETRSCRMNAPALSPRIVSGAGRGTTQLEDLP